MKYMISLGGSIINPGNIDTGFLREFKLSIMRRVKRGDRFFIVTGGGQVARDYQQAIRGLGRVTAADLDWIGIAATKLNAELLRVLFGRLSGKKIFVFSGTKPGWSTDYIAVRVAKTNKVKRVINLSDVDFVYTADPKKNKTARPMKQMTWQEFLRQFGSKRQPGGHYPFDPVAAAYAKRNKIAVVILNGRKLKNFESYLSGRPFRGTEIK